MFKFCESVECRERKEGREVSDKEDSSQTKDFRSPGYLTFNGQQLGESIIVTSLRKRTRNLYKKLLLYLNCIIYM